MYTIQRGHYAREAGERLADSKITLAITDRMNGTSTGKGNREGRDDSSSYFSTNLVDFAIFYGAPKSFTP